MKPDIHPELHLVNAVCACGNAFQVHSTHDELRLEICNECHPYFTGKQKLIDTAGRVERFKKRFEADPAEAGRRRPQAGLAAAAASTRGPLPRGAALVFGPPGRLW